MSISVSPGCTTPPREWILRSTTLPATGAGNLQAFLGIGQGADSFPCLGKFVLDLGQFPGGVLDKAPGNILDAQIEFGCFLAGFPQCSGANGLAALVTDATSRSRARICDFSR